MSEGEASRRCGECDLCCRLLRVDDLAKLGGVPCTYLRDPAVDGAAGLEATSRLRPALVLMDMSLPEMDGWEATRRLKADPEIAATPVIALTAHAMSGDREKALEAGCDEYDTKPIEFARLLEKISKLLGD